MLVFIDEAGDSGLKLQSGSSKYFTMGMVAFRENEEAIACDHRIRLLRKELRLDENFEFHFYETSSLIKRNFLVKGLKTKNLFISMPVDFCLKTQKINWKMPS